MTSKRAFVLVLAFSTVHTLASCSAGKATFTVDVRTDFRPFDEFRAVRTELLSTTSSPVESSRTSLANVDRTEDFVRGARVAEYQIDTPLHTVVRVTLLDAAGAPVVVRETRLDIRSSYALTVVITRDCRNVRCPGVSDAPSATTCYAGRCVSPDCRTDSTDACGVDECADDSDCPMPMVSCAQAQCIGGACFIVGHDDRCASTAWCSPELGCEPRGVMLDASVGPGFDAGARVDAGRFDAGPPHDSGPTPDGGPPRDAGGVDGWVTPGTDAGLRPDAGHDGGNDAGTDAGPPCDLVTSRIVNGLCKRCDVHVPGDAATITAGIAAAPAPGLVCVNSGTYAESFSMRRLVDVAGEPKGPSSVPTTVVNGFVSVIGLLGPDRQVTTLSNIAVHATANPAVVSCATPACAGESLIGGAIFGFVGEGLDLTSTPGPLDGSCGLFFLPGGQLELTVRDTTCAANAPYIVQHNPFGGVADEHVVFERDTVTSTAPSMTSVMGGTDSLSITLAAGSGSGTLPPGSRIRIIVRNVVFDRVTLSGARLGAVPGLASADAAASETRVSHCTFIDAMTRIDARAIIGGGTFHGGPFVVANNLWLGFAGGALGGRAADTNVGNLSATAPFFAPSSQRLAVGSPAIDTANVAQSTSDDRDGLPRPIDGDGDGSALPDVGAYEYRP